MADTLRDAMDEAGFELMQQNQPGVIEEIEKYLAAGGTAQQLERDIFKKFGRHSLTAALVAGAAHYIERQHKGTTK